MLVELHVVDLGIVADLDLVLGPGLTAITGETGAGKTLIVEAVDLLLGGRADAAFVRDGAAEARVEGRFVSPGTGEETVLARVIPARVAAAPTSTGVSPPRASWPSAAPRSSTSTDSTRTSRCSTRPCSGARSTASPVRSPSTPSSRYRAARAGDACGRGRARLTRR